MKSHYQMLCLLFLSLCPLLVSPPLRASDITWPDRNYSYVASGETIAELLSRFCANMGVNCLISEGVQGEVSGQFTEMRAKDFFRLMVRSHGLTWWYDGFTFFISDDGEHTTAFLPLEYIDFNTLVDSLKELQTFDLRFPLRKTSGGKLVMVSGPPTYVTRVEQTALSLDQQSQVSRYGSFGNRQVAVFKLNHAWASDRTMILLDQKVLIPGVANTLQRLVGGRDMPTGAYEAEAFQRHPGLKGAGLNRLTEPELPEPNLEQRNMLPEDEDKPVIVADPRINAVVVSDYGRNLPYYEELIKALDQEPGLVEIQASILDISVSASRDIGVDWNVSESGRVNANFGTAGQLEDRPSAPNNGLVVSTLIGGATEFLSRIKLLESEGDARIVSRPSVITMDNIEAQIQHKRTFYVRVAGDREVDLYPVDVGAVMRVTPHIMSSEKGEIRLAISIEDGSLSGETVDDIPILQQSAIHTQAVVAEGQSLLLGGYTQESAMEGEDRTPGFSKIPILKYLFRKRSRSHEKIERLFLITPRLVDPQKVPTLPEGFTRPFDKKLYGKEKKSGGN